MCGGGGRGGFGEVGVAIVYSNSQYGFDNTACIPLPHTSVA